MREWFQSLELSSLDNSEDDFIREIISQAKTDNLDSETECRDINTLSSYDEEDDLLDRAELSVGNVYIKLEPFCLDLLATIVKFKLGESGNISFSSYFKAIISFVLSIGKYFTHISDEMKDFCRYLTKNYYSYADRLNDLFSLDDNIGFSLDEAIEKYCQHLHEQNPDLELSELHCITVNVASQLIQEKILKPISLQNNRYCICF